MSYQLPKKLQATLVGISNLTGTPVEDLVAKCVAQGLDSIMKGPRASTTVTSNPRRRVGRKAKIGRKHRDPTKQESDIQALIKIVGRSSEITHTDLVAKMGTDTNKVRRDARKAVAEGLLRIKQDKQHGRVTYVKA